MSMFYDTREVSPVVSGTQTYTSGTSITLPAMFNTLSVTVYGASGGGGGGSWLAGTTIYVGTAGTAGGSTSFGGSSSNPYYVAVGGGGGGGGAGATYASYLYGYSAGSGNGTGSTGSDVTTLSPDASGIRAGGSGGSGAADNQNHQVVTSRDDYGNKTSWTDYAAANGGRGGNGGKNYIVAFNVNGPGGFDYIKNYYGASIACSLGGAGSGGAGGAGKPALNGSNGTAGYIVISWT
jgi:hypothetical protein